jgi:hypothetical protein
MDEKLVQEILDGLFSSLEALETRSVALLEFLKGKGLASDEELAPHFEQAANISNVRWRAARVRINHLLSSAEKTPAKVGEEESAKTAEKSPDPVRVATTKTDPSKDEKHSRDGQKSGSDAKQKAEDVGAAVEKSDNKQVEKNDRSNKDADKDKA